MSSTSISASSTHVFDPSAWLTQFGTVGGAFALTDCGLHLWIVPGERTDDELGHARRMVSRLTTDQRGAIKDHLGAQVGESPSSSSPTAQAPRTPAAAGVAGDPTERTDDMNMMTAIRARASGVTTATALHQLANEGSAWENAKAHHIAAEEAWVAAIAARDDVYDSYYQHRLAQPNGGLVLQKDGQVFSLDEALANLQTEQEDWKAADALCRDECGLSAADAKVAAASKINGEAWRALLACPVPDLAAAAHKLELISQTMDEDGELAAVLVDLRRLAGIAPPSSRQPDSIDRYWTAFHAFNANQFEEGAYMEAFEDLHDYTPATDRDFVRKFEAAFAHGGAPNGDRIQQLIGEASTLLGADSRIKPSPETIDATTRVATDMVGPDLTKAEPIADVIARLAPLRNGYWEDFLDACTASGMDVMVIRDRDGTDKLQIGMPADGQEALRQPRYKALTDQLKRGKFRRQQVIDALNLFGRFMDNQPFASIVELADAFLTHGGRLWLKPDGSLGEPWLPYTRDTAQQERIERYPLRRLMHRYTATLHRPNSSEALAAYICKRGKKCEGNSCIILEAEGLDHD